MVCEHSETSIICCTSLLLSFRSCKSGVCQPPPVCVLYEPPNRTVSLYGREGQLHTRLHLDVTTTGPYSANTDAILPTVLSSIRPNAATECGNRVGCVTQLREGKRTADRHSLHRGSSDFSVAFRQWQSRREGQCLGLFGPHLKMAGGHVCFSTLTTDVLRFISGPYAQPSLRQVRNNDLPLTLMIIPWRPFLLLT